MLLAASGVYRSGAAFFCHCPEKKGWVNDAGSNWQKFEMLEAAAPHRLACRIAKKEYE